MTPSLTPDEQSRLLGDERTCSECGNILSKNYCRQCDEFYWEGHQYECPRRLQGMFKTDHTDHRTY